MTHNVSQCPSIWLPAIGTCRKSRRNDVSPQSAPGLRLQKVSPGVAGFSRLIVLQGNGDLWRLQHGGHTVLCQSHCLLRAMLLEIGPPVKRCPGRPKSRGALDPCKKKDTRYWALNQEARRWLGCNVDTESNSTARCSWNAFRGWREVDTCL